MIENLTRVSSAERDHAGLLLIPEYKTKVARNERRSCAVGRQRELVRSQGLQIHYEGLPFAEDLAAIAVVIAAVVAIPWQAIEFNLVEHYSRDTIHRWP